MSFIPSSGACTPTSRSRQAKIPGHPALTSGAAREHSHLLSGPMTGSEEVRMASDTGDRMKIVIGYAVWATLCAAVAGVAISLIHTWFFSYHGTRPGLWRTLLEDAAATVGIAAGQGAVALVTGSLLTQLGRGLHATVLLGLLVGLFDFVMNFLQMAVPRTELGWAPDLIILTAATIAITVFGSPPAAPAPPAPC